MVFQLCQFVQPHPRDGREKERVDLKDGQVIRLFWAGQLAHTDLNLDFYLHFFSFLHFTGRWTFAAAAADDSTGCHKKRFGLNGKLKRTNYFGNSSFFFFFFQH
jgi:hypothetical protein